MITNYLSEFNEKLLFEIYNFKKIHEKSPSKLIMNPSYENVLKSLFISDVYLDLKIELNSEVPSFKLS